MRRGVANRNSKCSDPQARANSIQEPAKGTEWLPGGEGGEMACFWEEVGMCLPLPVSAGWITVN